MAMLPDGNGGRFSLQQTGNRVDFEGGPSSTRYMTGTLVGDAARLTGSGEDFMQIHIQNDGSISGSYKIWDADSGQYDSGTYTGIRLPTGTFTATGVLPRGSINYSAPYALGHWDTDDFEIVGLDTDFDANIDLETLSAVRVGTHTVSQSFVVDLFLQKDGTQYTNIDGEDVLDATGGTVTITRLDSRVVGSYSLVFGSYNLSGQFDCPVWSR